MGVQERLVQIRNELRAQKVASGLAYSSLLFPENTPQATWSGTVDLNSDDPVIVKFRFTRKDESLSVPLVDFPFTATVSPTYLEFARTYGFEITADDFTYTNTWDTAGYIGEVGDNYIVFYVEISRAILKSDYFSLSSVGVSLTVQAVSCVYGNLIVEGVENG